MDVLYNSQYIFARSREELTPTKYVPYPTPYSKYVAVRAVCLISHCDYYRRQVVISIARII